MVENAVRNFIPDIQPGYLTGLSLILITREDLLS